MINYNVNVNNPPVPKPDPTVLSLKATVQELNSTLQQTVVALRTTMGQSAMAVQQGIIQPYQAYAQQLAQTRVQTAQIGAMGPPIYQTPGVNPLRSAVTAGAALTAPFWLPGPLKPIGAMAGAFIGIPAAYSTARGITGPAGPGHNPSIFGAILASAGLVAVRSSLPRLMPQEVMYYGRADIQSRMLRLSELGFKTGQSAVELGSDVAFAASMLGLASFSMPAWMGAMAVGQIFKSNARAMSFAATGNQILTNRGMAISPAGTSNSVAGYGLTPGERIRVLESVFKMQTTNPKAPEIFKTAVASGVFDMAGTTQEIERRMKKLLDNYDNIARALHLSTKEAVEYIKKTGALGGTGIEAQNAALLLRNSALMLGMSPRLGAQVGVAGSQIMTGFSVAPGVTAVGSQLAASIASQVTNTGPMGRRIIARNGGLINTVAQTEQGLMGFLTQTPVGNAILAQISTMQGGRTIVDLSKLSGINPLNLGGVDLSKIAGIQSSISSGNIQFKNPGDLLQNVTALALKVAYSTSSNPAIRERAFAELSGRFGLSNNPIVQQVENYIASGRSVEWINRTMLEQQQRARAEAQAMGSFKWTNIPTIGPAIAEGEKIWRGFTTVTGYPSFWAAKGITGVYGKTIGKLITATRLRDVFNRLPTFDAWTLYKLSGDRSNPPEHIGLTKDYYLGAAREQIEGIREEYGAETAARYIQYSLSSEPFKRLMADVYSMPEDNLKHLLGKVAYLKGASIDWGQHFTRENMIKKIEDLAPKLSKEQQESIAKKFGETSGPPGKAISAGTDQGNAGMDLVSTLYNLNITLQALQNQLASDQVNKKG